MGNYGKEGNEQWFPDLMDDPQAYRKFLIECKRILKPGSHLYIMFDPTSLFNLIQVMREEVLVKNLIVWDKKRMGMGYRFRRRYELIVFAATPPLKGEKIRPLNNRKTPDIWQIASIHSCARRYPSEKPVELFQVMLECSAREGDWIIDPFMGSGSSGLAALKAGCNYLGNDLEERAVKLAEERIKDFLNTI